MSQPPAPHDDDRDDLARAEAQLADLRQQVMILEGRCQVAEAQLRPLADRQVRDMQERLSLALALDDPDALSQTLAQLTARVERAAEDDRQVRGALEARLRQGADDLRVSAERDQALAQLAACRDQAAQREAAFLSSTSWRVTAPLRAVMRALRR
ncbi:hypothetical protein [Paracoccus hibiscisoli]|uniref:Uncharacterized protein n=1 Tax=Paracoccus hibiscisoli TaxID=2023261 RepID=A0A4U0QZL5_9RHOB|nr:hypothetical protein [Paracoccus hibiscisoli]TJZ87370.1 hypothetical protein FA740_01310 [Paracoccus hibiscisoli]